MKVAYTIAEFKEERRKLTGTLGFVPTMGYLHEGHLELVHRARAENKNVAVSIFVNPAQFGPREDLEAYPRDPERDLFMLREEKVDLVLMPDVDEMYPADFSTWINVEGVTEQLEGAIRPGHFRGVATVVAKLFNIAEPTKAYFGQKDAQQLIVIRKMVADLNLNVEIVAVPTFREYDGLAMSSRNVYLDLEERESATVLYRALSLARSLHAKGETDAQVLRKEMKSLIESEPKAKIDYISIADPSTLKDLETISGPALVSLAVRIGKTRLIDNVILE